MLGGMVAAGVLFAVLLIAGHAASIQTTHVDEQRKQEVAKQEQDTFAKLKPDEQRERLRTSYWTAAREENPHLDGITTEIAKSKGGFDLWARHELFTRYTLSYSSSGSHGNKISEWMSEHREQLKTANIKRVGVKGIGAYASWSYYEP